MSNGGTHLLCDAMLGGLARWLRAAGYDAEFAYGADDGDLVNRARHHGAVLLSSDGPLFERTVIRSGRVAALFVPRGLDRHGQLVHVLRSLKLPVRAMPRCMACGGVLVPQSRQDAAAHVPARAFAACEDFWRCDRCGRWLWQGTHWRHVRAGLARAAAEAGVGEQTQ